MRQAEYERMEDSRQQPYRYTGIARVILAVMFAIWLTSGCGTERYQPVLLDETDRSEGVGVSRLDLMQMQITTHPAGAPCDRCHARRTGRKRQTNKPIPQLCYDCHDDYTSAAKYVHGPVAAGACRFCHEPHSSIYVNLQKLSQPGLCTQCHVMEDYNGSETHPNSSGRLCTECHDPHAGSDRMLLRR